MYKNQVKSVIDTGDPNTLLRNYLEAQYDQNAFVVLAGPATNLAAALDFRGMKELIATKTKYLVAACNSQSRRRVAAKKMFAEWPTPIIVAGPRSAFPGASIDKEFVAANPDNPVADAYRAWKPIPSDAPAAAIVATSIRGAP